MNQDRSVSFTILIYLAEKTCGEKHAKSEWEIQKQNIYFPLRFV